MKFVSFFNLFNNETRKQVLLLLSDHQILKKQSIEKTLIN
jgi:hypothetical protein